MRSDIMTGKRIHNDSHLEQRGEDLSHRITLGFVFQQLRVKVGWREAFTSFICGNQRCSQLKCGTNDGRSAQRSVAFALSFVDPMSLCSELKQKWDTLYG